jgi:catechol 2,3-dioxygenase-like lactoylglutathione lyase family enzyme
MTEGITPLEVYPRLLTSAGGFDAMLEFYRDGLGLVPAKVLPGHYASFDLGEATALALIVGDEFAELAGAKVGGTGDRQMVVLRVADVDAWTERAVTHGGTAVTPPTDRDYGLRSAHYRDPDGNLVELQSY